MKSSDTPLVAIRCITYNQAPYIRQCLDGFIMQRTDFPFVAIVHDDCSTDGTDDIVREYAQRYPDIIKPIFETENQYSKKDGSLGRIMTKACNETGAKYIAMCEGDDYWTDPLKLQKQVDILEKNPDSAMVYTCANVWNQDEKKFKGILGKEQNFTDLLIVNYIPTCTVVIRQTAYASYRKEIGAHNSWQMGDYPLFLYLSHRYGLKFIGDVTGVYRELKASASHSSVHKKQLKFYYSAHMCRVFFSRFLNDKKQIKKTYNSSMNFLLVYLIQNDLKFEKYLFDDIIKNKQLNVRCLILCFFASNKVCRSIMRFKYKLSNFTYKQIQSYRSKVIIN